MFLKIKNKQIGVHFKNRFTLFNNIKYAFKLNINTFSFFLGNPLSWNKKINNSDIYKFKYYLNKYNIKTDYIVPHSSYLINLCSSNIFNLIKSIKLFIKEINLCYELDIKFINFHLGSNDLRNININKCIDNVINILNNIINKTKKVILVIENSAGQDNAIGNNIIDISKIINNIDNKSRIGLCIDTCHAFAAGYDLRTLNKCDDFFLYINKIIGLNFLKVIHLNGSIYKYFSKLDKHSMLLKNNFLGYAVYYWIMTNNLFNNKPIILETPNSLKWIEELSWLYSI